VVVSLSYCEVELAVVVEVSHDDGIGCALATEHDLRGGEEGPVARVEEGGHIVTRHRDVGLAIAIEISGCKKVRAVSEIVCRRTEGAISIIKSHPRTAEGAVGNHVGLPVAIEIGNRDSIRASIIRIIYRRLERAVTVADENTYGSCVVEIIIERCASGDEIQFVVAVDINGNDGVKTLIRGIVHLRFERAIAVAEEHTYAATVERATVAVA